LHFYTFSNYIIANLKDYMLQSRKCAYMSRFANPQ